MNRLQELIDMIEGKTAGSPTLDDVWKSFKWALKADKVIKSKL